MNSHRTLKSCFLVAIIMLAPFYSAFGGRKNAVFMTGERLVYKVKFGFVKLGTLVIETGAPLDNHRINVKMKFWTAQVPFLDSKNTVTDIIDTSGICVLRFEEHSTEGKSALNCTMNYDPSLKTLTYNDDTTKNLVNSDVRPFSDAATLLFNLRTWNGSKSNYFFPMRGKNKENVVKCSFSQNESQQECPALNDKEIATYRVDGFADMGKNPPLGANGKFTAYVTQDNASIPIRLDMSIAIGSISLVLDKIERPGWKP